MDETGLQKHMYIEFIGLPGSGKTFLLKRLSRKNKKLKFIPSKIKCGETKYCTKLEKKNINWIYSYLPNLLQKKLAKKYYNIRFNREETEALLQFIEEYKYFLQIVTNILYKNDVRNIFLFIKRFENIIIDYKLSQAFINYNEMILFDEGFVQKIVGLHLNAGINYNDMKEYINSSPKPKLIVHVEVPIDTAHKRLDQRGWPGWLPSKKNLTKWQLLAQTKNKINDICEEYSSNNVPIINIQNEHTSNKYISKKFRDIEYLALDANRTSTQ